MSGEPYIDGDTLDQCREAIRQGGAIPTLASRLRCSPEHLARLLNLPSLKPATQQLDDFDLWAADKLEGVL